MTDADHDAEHPRTARPTGGVAESDAAGGGAPSERIAVLGMLRSGTSLMTALLERAGLSTGRPDRFVIPGPANPLGFFEHTAVAEANRLLLGGSGLEAVEIAVAESPDVAQRADHYRGTMSEIIGELEPHRPWVIKHPALSLTFPWWSGVVPGGLSAVVMVRDPRQATASLGDFARGEPAVGPFGLALWEAFTVAALNNTRSVARSVVLHHRLLADAAATMRTVARELGLGVDLPEDRAFEDLIRPRLHRHMDSTTEIPPAIADLWDRVQAGDVDEHLDVSSESRELLARSARHPVARAMSRQRRSVVVLVCGERTLLGDRAVALARRSWAKVSDELRIDIRYVYGNVSHADEVDQQPADLRAYLSQASALPNEPLPTGSTAQVEDMIFCGTPDSARFAADAPLRKALLAMQHVVTESADVPDAIVVVDAATHVAAHRLAEVMGESGETLAAEWFADFGDRSPVIVSSEVARELVSLGDIDGLAAHRYPRSVAGFLAAVAAAGDVAAVPVRASAPIVADWSGRPPAGHHANGSVFTLFSPSDVSAVEWFHDRFFRHTRPPLPRPARPNVPADDRIFIQIPSYRDPQLPKTVASAFENAADPSRVRFGICWQYDEWTSDDLEPWMDDPRVSVDEVHYPQSKGCCWARQRANDFYDGEGYFLQIDAHMRFAPGWDRRLIEMLEACDAPKPILTTYPPALLFDEDGNDVLVTKTGVQSLSSATINDTLATVQYNSMAPNSDAPGPSRFLAGGFNFSHGQLVQEVPSDPDVYFSGEEVALAARAFTHGYDLFYPNENVIWHLYAHEAPKHWTDSKSYPGMHDQAVQRMRTLLIGDHASLGRFGLGDLRTVGDFETRAGLDFRAARLGLDHVEPTIQEVAFSLDGLVPEGCDHVVCTVLNEDGLELARVDQVDPDVLSGERTFIEAKVRVPGKAVEVAVLPRTPEGFAERVVVALR